MKKRVVACVLLMAIALSGCIYRAASGGELDIYRVNADAHSGGAALRPERVSYSSGDAVSDVIMKYLNAQPGRVTLERAFPEGVEMLSCRISGGVATVEMSESYAKLTGTEKLLADYAISYTLVSVDEVLSVDIVCGGRKLVSGLSAGDAVLWNMDYEEAAIPYKLFVPSASMDRLVPVSGVAESGEGSAEEQLCAELLGQMDFLGDDAELISAVKRGNCCFVNLSSGFLEYVPADKDEGELILQSFAHSLCSLVAVDSVVIQVEGLALTEYAGSAVAWPLEPDKSFVVF